MKSFPFNSRGIEREIEFLSEKGFFSPFFEKNMWMQIFLVESHISHNSRPLINSPSQNEIVG
jgi:hypothetical protein